MRILGVIPARGGSKSVPRKNIKELGGKPLIAWTIEASLQSNLDKVIVSTDDAEIAEVARKFNAEVPFLRPSHLATDSAGAIENIQHSLRFFIENGDDFDAVMMLQPTAPFRNTDDINKAIEMFNEHDTDSVISVIDVEGHHPARMKYMDSDGFLIDPDFCEAKENQPRQELEPMYLRNGGIYLTRKEVLLSGSFKGKKSLGLQMPAERSVNIDTPMDFKYTQWIYDMYFS